MRQWLRTLTCIRTGTIFGWHMKVNWRQSHSFTWFIAQWFTLGCKMTWFWYSFPGSWVISLAALETLKCGAGNGSREPKCQGTAWETFCILRRPWAAPWQSAGTGVRKLHPPPPQQEFCFLRAPVSARLEDKGLLCLEVLARSKSHLIGTFSSDVAVVFHQGLQQEDPCILQMTEIGRSRFTCSRTQRWFPTKAGI